MRIHFALFSFFLAVSSQVHADQLDKIIAEEMQKRQIPGLSLAVVDGGKIVKIKTYGVVEKGSAKPVTPETLFQAGSVSKPVAAFGTLHLVSQGKLELDQDVNEKLVSWKIPENAFTKDKKVTLRRIMSHSASFSVHGFRGYAKGEAVPSLLQVLNGEKPANSGPIRVMYEPGTKYQYAGGGTTVMQQLVIDVTGKPYDQYMQEQILTPLGMRHSSYTQPVSHPAQAATAHTNRREKVPGSYHIYPEMAAAGLWTTATDLAKFSIAVQQAYAGKANTIVSHELAKQMLSPQIDQVGLGFFLNGKDKTSEFSHGGRDEGFDTWFAANVHSGQSVVIMINTNDNSGMMRRIAAAVAKNYHWPTDKADTKPQFQTVNPRQLNKYAGYYDNGLGGLIEFSVYQNQLASISDGFIDISLQMSKADRFEDASGKIRYIFTSDRDTVTHILAEGDQRPGSGIKISPLLSKLKAAIDPQTARTQHLLLALKTLAQGGEATAKSDKISAGAKRDLREPMMELKGLSSLVFIHEQTKGINSITRHGDKAASLLAYRTNREASSPYIFIYVNDRGQLIDYDLVSN